MSENTLVNDMATDAASTTAENQAQAAKTYTQDEVNDMMARMKGSLQKKLLKPYEDLGDPEELRSLRIEAEKRAQEQQIKRGEFEKTLQDLAAKKDAEISKRDSIIKEYKINTPLISAAAKYNAVNAEQVKALLNANIRLGDSGEVEVVDSKGSVRYSDKGEPIGVDDLVREFLDTNPHFKLANPATTATKSNISGPVSGKKVDISKLDMTNPEHRAAYKEYRKSNGLV
jgi:hypothetical protein